MGKNATNSRLGVAAAAMAALLAGCTAAGDNGAAPAAAEGNAAAPEAAAPAAPAQPMLQIHGEGLRLADPAGGEGANLTFGAAQAEVLARLGFLDQPEVSTNDECGAGPMEIAQFRNGLSLLFQERRFVGWSVDGRIENRLPTTLGINTGGSTRAELEAAYPGAAVEESTLGHEFSADGLGGLLGGTGPDARITAMWAGTTCMFR